jgi:hypothetical protein
MLTREQTSSFASREASQTRTLVFDVLISEPSVSSADRINAVRNQRLTEPVRLITRRLERLAIPEPFEPTREELLIHPLPYDQPDSVLENERRRGNALILLLRNGGHR